MERAAEKNTRKSLTSSETRSAQERRTCIIIIIIIIIIISSSNSSSIISIIIIIIIISSSSSIIVKRWSRLAGLRDSAVITGLSYVCIYIYIYILIRGTTCLIDSSNAASFVLRVLRRVKDRRNLLHLCRCF